jgi:WD40 repeat protein
MKAFIDHKTRLGLARCLALLLITLFTICWSTAPVHTLAQDSREIMRLGRGTANALDWRPDGEVLAVGSATGVWLLDESLNIIDHPETIESITSVAWSPDGVQVALTGYVGEVCLTQIWDAEFSTNDEIAFCGEGVKWSPDGSRLTVTQAREATIALIDPSNGMIIATLLGQSGVWSLDGKTFITSAYLSLYLYRAEEPALYVWDSVTGEQLRRTAANDEYGFGRLLWSAEAGKVAVWCNENGIDDRVFINICDLDVASGQSSKVIKLTSVHSGSNVFPEQPQRIIAGENFAYINVSYTRGFLNNIVLFNPRTSEHKNIGSGQAFSQKPNSNIITSIIGNGLIANIDITTGEVLQEQMLFTAPINSVAWRPNGEQIASVGFGYEQDARVWDATQAAYEPDMMWHVEPAEHVFYTPDNQELVSAGTIRTDIIINHDIAAWDADTGERSRGIDGFYSQFDPFPLIAWNKDFTHSVRSDRDDKVQISESLTITTAGSETFNIVWSPDETKIATVSKFCGDCDYIIETWDISTGELINTIQGFQQFFGQLVWSPNSEMIAVLSLWNPMAGQDRRVSIYTIEKNKDYCCNQSDSKYFDLVDYPKDAPFDPVQISWKPDSSQIALAFQYAVNIYQVTNGEQIFTVPMRGVGSLAYSPDGTMLALGMSDGTIRIWDVSDLTQTVDSPTLAH